MKVGGIEEGRPHTSMLETRSTSSMICHRPSQSYNGVSKYVKQKGYETTEQRMMVVDYMEGTSVAEIYPNKHPKILGQFRGKTAEQ